MQLRFFARPGHVLRLPGPKPQGQFVPAVGRSKRVAAHGIELPAQVNPTECDLSSDRGKLVARRCRQTPLDPPVWAADQETARALGIQHVEVEYVDGEFHPVGSTEGSAA
jgi:hypothetical protein